MKKVILFLVLLSSAGACRPVKEIQYIDKYREVIKTDSVYKFQKDTVFETRKGDTVFLNRIKTLIDYKYKFLSKVDTVTKIETKVKTETVVKEKKVTGWFGWIDWALIGLAFGYGAFRLLRFMKLI